MKTKRAFSIDRNNADSADLSEFKSLVFSQQEGQKGKRLFDIETLCLRMYLRIYCANLFHK